MRKNKNRKETDGINEALVILFKQFPTGSSFDYLLGMLDFAIAFGAITQEEYEAMYDYIEEREAN